LWCVVFFCLETVELVGPGAGGGGGRGCCPMEGGSVLMLFCIYIIIYLYVH